jgi:lipopolysaccharide heptosyltransferase I
MPLNILIIKPSSLGDIVHGLQVAQSIREQIPDCSINWIVRERFAPLVELCDTVDEMFIFYRKGGVKAFYQLIKTLRQQTFDYVLDFQGLARSGLMTYFARSSHKFGRTDAREFARLAYNKNAPLPSAGRQSHAIEILLRFLPLMGLHAELKGELCFQIKPVTSIDARLAEKSYVLMFPGSQRSEKKWAGFEPLTQKILRTFLNLFVVWGSDVEFHPPHFSFYTRFFNMTGKTELHEMISLVKHAALVIANDSGPLHLAAALQKSLVAIFGPTSIERFGPYPLNRATHHIIQAPDGDLTRLRVRTVFNIVKQALDSA